MIKAAGHDADGRPVLILGLTPGNLQKLAARRPILVRTGELGMRPAFEVWVLGGPTLGAIYSELETVGVVVPDDAHEDATGVLCFSLFYKASGPPRPVVVLGVSDVGGRRLLTGETVSFAAADLVGNPGPDPVILMLADQDTDVVQQRMVAFSGGRPPQQIIDLRGGRTD